MNLTIDAAWAAGLLLSMTRLIGFVIASPMMSRLIPVAGRVAFVVSVGFLFAEPVTVALGFGDLILAAGMNAFVGILLGFATGLIFHLFTVAGALIDDLSGLRVGSIVDPMTGANAAVFGRVFGLTAIVTFLVVGGHRLLIRGLAATYDAIPLDGSLDLAPGLADSLVSVTGRMLIAAVEMAMPALAALFIAEVVLGIASRFAPQANIFLLGLPAKVITALASVWLVLLLLPDTLSGAMGIIERSFADVIGALTP